MQGFGVTIHYKGGTLHSRTFASMAQARKYAEAWERVGALVSIVRRSDAQVAR